MRPVLALVLIGAGLLVDRPAAAAGKPVVVTTGEAVTVAVPVAPGNRPGGVAVYRIDASPGVQIVGSGAGTVTWKTNARKVPSVPVRLIVHSPPPSSPFVAARVIVTWAAGDEQVVEIPASVRHRESDSTGDGTVEAELIALPRTASPGGRVRLSYTVLNYDDAARRVRIRVIAAPGWALTDPALERDEHLVEAWDTIDGEALLSVPDDAVVGARQEIRLRVEVPGIPGGFDAREYVTVTKPTRSGSQVVSGTSSLGMTHAAGAPTTAGALMAGLTVSSKLSARSNISFAFNQGRRESLSNIRYFDDRTVVTGSMRHNGWDLSFGNSVSSPSNALNGPYVRGRGAALRHLGGRLIADLTIAQPNGIETTAAGKLVRGRIGMQTPRASLALNLSTFERPAGGYTLVPTAQPLVVDADTADRLKFEQQLTRSAASNRVRGAGLEGELHVTKTQVVSVRSGALVVEGASTARSSGMASEAGYRYSSPRVLFNTRWRNMPATVPGISIPGDEWTSDGSVRVTNDFRVLARTYRSATDTIASALHSSGEGLSAGFGYMHAARRLELQGNIRESDYGRRVIRRTMTATGALPAGPLVFTTSVDAGTEEAAGVVTRVAFYHSDVRWTGTAGTISFSGSRTEGGSTPLTRLDLLGSVKVRAVELSGGAWLTAGYIVGGRPGRWFNVVTPLAGASALVVGLDYSPQTWVGAPSLRASLSVRQRFDVSLPSLH